MKRVSIICLVLIAAFIFYSPIAVYAQRGGVPSSLGASVSQRLGTETDITVVYSRPGVKGRTIWGELVPYGLAPGTDYTKGKPFPWRAGANQNTTFEFSTDVKVEGKELAAGKYGIHMIPSEKDWIVIFSKKNDASGSYTYDQKEDALRITVTPTAAPHQEWLAFGFEDLAGTSGTAFLHWEKLKVSFKIEAPK